MAGPAKNNVTDSARPSGSATPQPESRAIKEAQVSSHLEPRAGQFAELAVGDPSSFDPSTRSKVITWLASGMAWILTILLITVALLRLTYYDATNFLTCLNAFTRYVYLPAYACLAWAIWKHRWVLVLA